MEYIPPQYIESLQKMYKICFYCWRKGYKFEKIKEAVEREFGQHFWTDEEIKERFRFMFETELSDNARYLKKRRSNSIIG